MLCPGGQLLRNPGEDELARCIGLVAPDRSRTGSMTSPSSAPGRPASPPPVYAGSEGLSVLVLDCRAFGGQAGASARIENYLGFPTGITGMALMARAYNQAQKFGVEMAIPDEVGGARSRPSDAGDGDYVLQLVNGERARARAVVIASGARYRAPRRRRTSRSSRRRACTTGPRRSKAGCAPARRWRWSAPATRPARRRSIWRARPRRCG